MFFDYHKFNQISIISENVYSEDSCTLERCSFIVLIAIISRRWLSIRQNVHFISESPLLSILNNIATARFVRIQFKACLEKYSFLNIRSLIWSQMHWRVFSIFLCFGRPIERCLKCSSRRSSKKKIQVTMCSWQSL